MDLFTKNSFFFNTATALDPVFQSESTDGIDFDSRTPEIPPKQRSKKLKIFQRGFSEKNRFLSIPHFENFKISWNRLKPRGNSIYFARSSGKILLFKSKNSKISPSLKILFDFWEAVIDFTESFVYN